MTPVLNGVLCGGFFSSGFETGNGFMHPSVVQHGHNECSWLNLGVPVVYRFDFSEKSSKVARKMFQIWFDNSFFSSKQFNANRFLSKVEIVKLALLGRAASTCFSRDRRSKRSERSFRFHFAVKGQRWPVALKTNFSCLLGRVRARCGH